MYFKNNFIYISFKKIKIKKHKKFIDVNIIIKIINKYKNYYNIL